MSIEDDRIEKLKRKLYSRTSEPVLDVRSTVLDESEAVKNSWGNDSGLKIPEDMRHSSHTHPILKKFLFGALLFFVLSVALSAYLFFGGGNLISSSNVDIKIAGPSVVASGEEVDLNISLINQNHADLQTVVLSIEYPTGASADKDASLPLVHSSDSVGTIPSGSTVDRAIKIFLLGDKDEVKTITLKLEYQVAGSNAVFSKVKKYDITIGSSPVILNVASPQEVSAGQEISFNASVSSNSSSLLRNVVLVAEYPYGFTFNSSSQTAKQGNTVWNLGDLKSGDKKTIVISGTLQAQDGEQRTFKFSVGTKIPGSTKDVDTVLSQANPTITVSKPFIDAHMAFAGDESASIPTNAGDNMSGLITFSNTLPEQIHDVSASVVLTGSALDRQSVQVGGGGFYQSSNNTILWDKNSVQSFNQINPGDSKNISFSFTTLRLPVGTKNPTVQAVLTVRGTRTSSSGAVGDVSVVIAKTIKINANLTLVAKSLQGGPIVNTGSHPPRAESPSAYTINWALSNMWNDVSGAKVTTTLPTYMEWTGQVSPSTANIMYNSGTRTIVWSPDSVSAGAGFTVSPKEVFFQVKINPSLSQVGSAPNLISSISFVGNDTFSGKNISFTLPALTTVTNDFGGTGYVTK